MITLVFQACPGFHFLQHELALLPLLEWQSDKELTFEIQMKEAWQQIREAFHYSKKKKKKQNKTNINKKSGFTSKLNVNIQM